MDTFFSGTSGMVLPVANKSQMPPEFQSRSRLAYYATLFNSLEVNSSFYKVPMAATVGKWAADVPDGFKFTFKLWRDITHNRGLAFDPEAVKRFMQVIAEAGDKRGSLLIQVPPSLTVAAMEPLEKLLACVQQYNTAEPEPLFTGEIGHAAPPWQVAVEFRHKSWYQYEVYDMLNDYDAGIVAHDMPASATPEIENFTDFVYLRFHGPDGSYKGGYTQQFLTACAQRIKAEQAAGKTVYTYFNNTAGDALANLLTVNELVTGRPAAI